MMEPLTKGVHHIGLAVPDLKAAEAFFVSLLGWTVTGGVPTYPATFVSDGTAILTLWQVSDPANAICFDRRSNVGLHHLALKVTDRKELDTAYERVRSHPGVVIEFAPGPMREGSPFDHFICTMPGGIRLEFATSRP